MFSKFLRKMETKFIQNFEYDFGKLMCEENFR